ncbi:MAG: LysR family transcriptional regulator [Roseibium sp.]|uniref:LysR family transcriptional regulator n=1 Tax=Roseibium sp. TaxID=1936156 RepID=UPI0026154588|nr:LysR family transcriptional regulator [Roseibium sp.]MCV0425806.1 LysR family transcriptional regulator [Roseibium sp.]
MSETDIPMTVARALMLIDAKGSVSEAARSLGVTQPAISKGISQLEQRIGTPLLQRGTRPVALTGEGRIVADYAARADRLQQQFLQDLEEAVNSRSGTVRLGSFGSSASFQILPRTLAAFARQHPGVSVEIIEFPDGELRQVLEEGIVDLAVMTVPDDDSLDIAPIATDKLVALVGERHPLVRHEEVTAADLSNYPFILTKGGSGPLVESWFAAAGRSPKAAHTILQVNSILALVEAGLGVSIIAELALPENLGKCRVVQLSPEAPRTIGFVRKGKTARSKAVEQFWRFCEQYAY